MTLSTPSSSRTSAGASMPAAGAPAKAAPIITAREFRDHMGHFATGVTIITGHDGQSPLGFTCQSFASLSVEPQLVTFSVMNSSTTYPRIRETGSCTVNILSAHQRGTATQFARSGTDKWAGIDWRRGAVGNPRIVDCAAWVDCRIVKEHPAGDHTIVVAAVTGIGTGTGTGNDLDAIAEGRDMDTHPNEPASPLIFHRGAFRGLSGLPVQA